MSQPIVVREFMTTALTTLDDSAYLIDAALILRRTGFRHLPILSGERLVGLITDRDINRYAPSLLSNITQEEYNAIFENTPLQRVMVKDPVTVEPATPMREVVAMLHNKKLGCMPVVEDGKLVGIITTTDMLKLLHRLLTGPGAPKAVVELK